MKNLIKLNKKRLLALSAACMAVSVLLVGFICYDLMLKRPRNTINIREDFNISYLVFQKKNPYIESPFLGMDENYLHTYTDYIKIDSMYECVLSEKNGAEYTYNATVVLVSRYKKNPGAAGNPEIMEKPYLINTETASVASENISVSKSFDLYLEPYIKELEDFAATIDLPVSSEIRVDFNIELKTSGGTVITDNYKRNIVIPVGTEFYNITVEGDKSHEKDHSNPVQRMSVFTAIFLSGVCIAFFIAGLVIIKKSINNKSPYRREIDGYLKTYDDIIISTETPPNFENQKIIIIKSFKELLNFSRIINAPILHAESSTGALFYVINDDISYLFEVDSELYS